LRRLLLERRARPLLAWAQPQAWQKAQPSPARALEQQLPLQHLQPQFSAF
jgi:hypothetical protein